MKVRRRIGRQPRVEMLPLIDVVFLLLIVFIYAMLSMAVHRGLDLDLPESTTAQPSKEDILSISVKHTGKNNSELLVLMDDVRVDLQHLGEELRLSSGTREKQQAMIFAEETISYQELFMVLDQLKTGGIEQISLQADKGGE